MKPDLYTQKGGTMTTRGFIPHLKHHKGFEMPVCLRIPIDCEVRTPRAPAIRKGYFLFALPGGGLYESEILAKDFKGEK